MTQIVYQHTIDGLFKVALKGKITPKLFGSLVSVGLDLGRPLQKHYPRATWDAALQMTASTLWPGMSAYEAHSMLGRELMLGYAQTLFGRAAVALGRLVGPAGTLKQMGSNIRSACNYTECTVREEPGGGRYFWINDTNVNAGFFAGMLAQALEISGGKNVRVSITDQAKTGFTYRVQWGGAEST